MSMICTLLLAKDDEIRQLLEEPESVYDFIEEERTSFDLDKMWHGIHWLLTGSADVADEPHCYLMLGGESVGDEDVGYGPARAITSQQVADWNRALSGISRAELALRFDPKEMLNADIYPQIWDRSITGEEDTLEYLLQAYDALRDFVGLAQRDGSGLLVFLS